MSSLRITYVLPRPELGGGNKVIFQHALLLRRLGHEVTLLGDGPRPDWFEVGEGYVDYSGAAGKSGPVPVLPEQDLVIATFWTTLGIASRLVRGPLAHFCQGYEGGLAHLRPLLPEIEAAYAAHLPTLTVAPHLGRFLAERFGRESRIVSPPLDPLFRPAFRLRPRRHPWVAIPGIFAAEVKGVSHALRAIQLLRKLGYPCRVLRYSALPLTVEEREIVAPDLYLASVSAARIAGALRACDLLLMPSLAEEGFGLPLLEAMASKVPAVASRIPSTVYMAEGEVELVLPADPRALAAAARRLLGDAGAWRAARRRGFNAAQRFRPEVVGPQLVEAIAWARERALERKGEVGMERRDF
jgi:glycosyltransferase involved in cell wall biosynthesis